MLSVWFQEVYLNRPGSSTSCCSLETPQRLWPQNLQAPLCFTVNQRMIDNLTGGIARTTTPAHSQHMAACIPRRINERHKASGSEAPNERRLPAQSAACFSWRAGGREGRRRDSGCSGRLVQHICLHRAGRAVPMVNLFITSSYFFPVFFFLLPQIQSTVSYISDQLLRVQVDSVVLFASMFEVKAKIFHCSNFFLSMSLDQN